MNIVNSQADGYIQNKNLEPTPQKNNPIIRNIQGYEDAINSVVDNSIDDLLNIFSGFLNGYVLQFMNRHTSYVPGHTDMYEKSINELISMIEIIKSNIKRVNPGGSEKELEEIIFNYLKNKIIEFYDSLKKKK